MWGIGNGKSTKILLDNWVPGLNPEFIQLLSPLPEAVTVDFLIDEDHGTWNDDLIRSVFEEDVASRILRIPISRHGGSDFVSWPHNKFGIYTVRSAYNLARTQEFNQTRSLSKRGLSSNMDEEASLWKRLWKITAPGKMK
jgi:hypothetical protein